MRKKGFTVVELLVVLGSIALILLATVSLLMSSLSSSGKAESIKEVRHNGDLAITTIRSLLTSSGQIEGCSSTVPNPIPTGVIFTSNNNQVEINCVTNGTDSYIASNSARLTDRGVVVSGCTVYCIQPPGGAASVKINFTLAVRGQDGLADSQRVSQEFNTSIVLLGL